MPARRRAGARRPTPPRGAKIASARSNRRSSSGIRPGERAVELQAQQAEVTKSREALTREIEDLRFQEAQATEREKDAAERLA